MAYAQWVVVSVHARNTSLMIKNARLAWGKFFRDQNKDTEISSDDINRIVIADNDTGVIASCGRTDASSGTEGSFDIYDGGTHVGTYYWDCPWGARRNTSTWTGASGNYVVQVAGANLDSGALGNVRIICVKI